MASTIPPVDGYIRKNKKWAHELQKLREIVLDCGLTEQFKWRNPCYTVDDLNVIILGAFMESCVISFMKGALLKDPKKILIKPGENSQSTRIVRFTNVQQITPLESTLKTYIREAIKVAESGAKVQLKKITEYAVPEEFQAKLEKNAKLKKAFQSLTPGRQRGYLMHFGSAKQSATRESRIAKCLDRILAGKGLDD